MENAIKISTKCLNIVIMSQGVLSNVNVGASSQLWTIIGPDLPMHIQMVIIKLILTCTYPIIPDHPIPLGFSIRISSNFLINIVHITISIINADETILITVQFRYRINCKDTNCLQKCVHVTWKADGKRRVFFYKDMI